MKNMQSSFDQSFDTITQAAPPTFNQTPTPRRHRERPQIDIDIVKEQTLYNTFMAMLCSEKHGNLEPVEAWQMFRLQCDAKMAQNEIGFFTFVQSPGHGVFFVFTLPAGIRKQTKTMETLVRDMLMNCVWGTWSCRYKFDQEEVHRIVKSTTHLTKMHLPVLGWEDMALSSGEQVNRARAYQTRCSKPLENVWNEEHSRDGVREALPMLRKLSVSEIKALTDKGMLVHVAEKHLGVSPSDPRGDSHGDSRGDHRNALEASVNDAEATPSTAPNTHAGAIGAVRAVSDCTLGTLSGCTLSGCTHEELVSVNVPEYCEHCGKEQGLGDAICAQCGSTNIHSCEGCGCPAGPESYRRSRCSVCQLLLCTHCSTRAQVQVRDHEWQAKILRKMAGAGEGCDGEDDGEGEEECMEPEAEIYAIVQAIRAAEQQGPSNEHITEYGKVGGFEPDSPALMRVYEEIADAYQHSLQHDPSGSGRSERGDPGELGKSGAACTLETRIHAVNYARPEAAEMKQYDVGLKEAVMAHTLQERGIKVWWPGASEVDIQRMLPCFVDLYIELFGACYTNMGNLISKYAEPMFERFVCNAATARTAGVSGVSGMSGKTTVGSCGNVGQMGYKLPKMTHLLPEVWEHLERLIKGDPTIMKCRACEKQFSSISGELLCSERCKEKHKAANAGLVCTTCMMPIVKRHPDRYAIGQAFYNPEDRSWYPAGLLEMSETEIRAEFPIGESKRNSVNSADPCEERVAFVMETKRKKNPIIFCNCECEEKWRSKLICRACGWEAGKDEGACKKGGKKREGGKGGMGADRTPDAPDAVTRSPQKPFPNLDELPKSSSSTEFERFAKAKLWKQKQSCAKCAGLMLPRMPVRVA